MSMSTQLLYLRLSLWHSIKESICGFLRGFIILWPLFILWWLWVAINLSFHVSCCECLCLWHAIKEIICLRYRGVLVGYDFIKHNHNLVQRMSILTVFFCVGASFGLRRSTFPFMSAVANVSVLDMRSKKSFVCTSQPASAEGTMC